MYGISQLQPPATGQTAAQRLAFQIANIDARLTDLERTRPALSTSTDDPGDSAPVPGTMHLNEAEGRFWIYTGERWITSDTEHVYAENLDALTAPNDAYLWDGPAVELNVSSYGLVAIFADVTLTAADASQVGVAVQLTGSTTTSFQIMSSTSTTPQRRSTAGGGLIASLGPERGAIWGVGGWLAFPATPGDLTITMGYASGGSPGAASDRRLYALVL